MPTGVYVRDEKYREMIGNRFRGKPLSKKSIEKRTKTRQERGIKPNKGKHLSIEWKRKISEAVRGSKSYLWNGLYSVLGHQ